MCVLLPLRVMLSELVACLRLLNCILDCLLRQQLLWRYQWETLLLCDVTPSHGKEGELTQSSINRGRTVLLLFVCQHRRAQLRDATTLHV